ncbi:shikimate kinase [Pseudoclavibacter endophyticus]|uniref:Shikimate kinase n=1 Tax=Pseudoclavibacter endophyticus TaxID=1778590 RepID=A0A6H9WV55_9MICO|nr:shikimate kinase [Pseudoclavibacter endophyticus]KAB1650080.1 shikimate kinase [Pseudoclavibacter endophyticus]GGA57450.1 shikimate kinase [Pseudoclavibacter endophyticus]
MTIAFIGPPAAGKSRAGRRLARRLGASYADTDRRIAADHGPISELFATRGEAAFRALERDYVARALREVEVVSLGGGAVMDDATQALLGHHTVIQVLASPAAIEQRISGSTKRPLIKSLDDWRAIYERRREVYERLADATFDTSFRPMSRVVDDIEAWLRETNHAVLGTARHEGTSTI